MSLIPFKDLLPLEVGELDRNEQRQVMGGDGSLVAVIAHECLGVRIPEMEEAARQIVLRVNVHDELLELALESFLLLSEKSNTRQKWTSTDQRRFDALKSVIDRTQGRGGK